MSSSQTRAVLGELGARMPAWQHGYDLARATGLKSGTLYPMLARLAEQGFLETMWEREQPTGRPRRHLYRLTPDGARAAAELTPQPDARPTRAAAELTPQPDARPTRAPATRPGTRIGHAY